VPCYATQKWFDSIPTTTACCRRVKEDDRADTPRFSWYLHWNLPEPRLKWVRENDQWRNLVRSYLACTSFVDAQVGRVLDALERRAWRRTRSSVVWGDHGWHLGEKAITGKNTLWDDGTRVPLIFAGPGVSRGSAARSRPSCSTSTPRSSSCAACRRATTWRGSASCRSSRREHKRERPAITSHNQGNHGVRSERWRYIRYADGSEELYDMQSDPRMDNLAGKPEYAAVIAEHRRWLPKIDEPPAPGSAHRVLTYDKAADEAIWEGQTVRRSDPIPRPI
jgi:choline-sulfatase